MDTRSGWRSYLPTLAIGLAVFVAARTALWLVLGGQVDLLDAWREAHTEDQFYFMLNTWQDLTEEQTRELLNSLEPWQVQELAALANQIIGVQNA